MFPDNKLITFLLTPAPALAEIPSLKLIKVMRNFLILSVSEVSWAKREKPVMPRPLLMPAIPMLLGITLCVGGTGTVHTDTGVVTLLQKKFFLFMGMVILQIQ